MHYGALLFLFEPFDHLGLLGIAALLGVYAGIYVFLRGFRMLQHKRLVLNTPLSKIRSASMGLVEVSGMPKGPQIWNESVNRQTTALLFPCPPSNWKTYMAPGSRLER